MDESDDFFVASRKPGYIYTISFAGQVPIQLVWCPPGEFIMGFEYNGPISFAHRDISHKVTLTKGFWIGRTTITQEQWSSVMSGPVPYIWRQLPGNNMPAIILYWADTVRFCKQLTDQWRANGLLTSTQQVISPSEAQWEYACRAGTATAWYFGDDRDNLAEHAWYKENSDGHPHQVALKTPNPWGLYDVYGNVSEWCLDDINMYSSQHQVDPLFIDKDPRVKIVRGGNYHDSAEICQSAWREGMHVDNEFGEPTGVRIVCVED